MHTRTILITSLAHVLIIELLCGKLPVNKTFVHVYDVVADWSYALAGFLVFTLFGVFPGQPFIPF